MVETVINLEVGRAPVCVGEAAFLFADIVGFTAFTEARGDVCAAELAWRLRLGVERQLGANAHVVKTLGDAVMVRISDPADAAAAGLRIVQRALPGPLDPAVRVGIGCGPAVECDGDFFGAAVNLAARLAALADAGEVLVTEGIAQGAFSRGIELERCGSKNLRNISRPVVVYALRGRSLAELASKRPSRARRAPVWTLRPSIGVGNGHA